MANNRLPFGLCKKYGIKLPDGATPKDAWEALKKNGIEYIEDEKPTVVKNNEQDEHILSKVENNTALSADDINRAISYFSQGYTLTKLRKSGIPDECLKSIMSLKGFDKTPQPISMNNIEEILSSTPLYRGVSEEKFASEFYEGDIWVGQGFFGNGIYMSIDEKEAKKYIEDRGGIVSSKTLITVFMPDSFNIAPDYIKEEHRAFVRGWEKENQYLLDSNDLKEVEIYENELNFIRDLGKYCILKGYDGYFSIKGKDVVVLNRGKLKYVKK